jgi:hypothetical protein
VTEAAMSESAIIVCDGAETILVVRAGLLPCEIVRFLAGDGINHDVATPRTAPLRRHRSYIAQLVAMVRLVAT